ncbi:hypothetical protein [Yersinia aldovae]|uniref:hypothetical protein n=1 Tax=Yersinia aldovae TaxID=29483 RepID=UPI0005ABEEA5|nr:hypothetical protein [Yersinia aldovae]AJJ63384.1 hypothetical protein AT01_2365 [Yersinia aldovae 670-83]
MQISRSTQDSIVKAFRHSETRVHFVDLSKLKNALTNIKNDSKSLGQIPTSGAQEKLVWVEKQLTKMQTTLESQGSKKLEAKSEKISKLMTQVNNLLKEEGVIESNNSQPQDIGRTRQERDTTKADLMKTYENHTSGFGFSATTSSNRQDTGL